MSGLQSPNNNILSFIKNTPNFLARKPGYAIYPLVLFSMIYADYNNTQKYKLEKEESLQNIEERKIYRPVKY